MDRIDISIAVKPVAYQELFDLAGEESSATIRQRVEAVRQKQLRRYQKESFQFNSQLPQKKIPEYIQLDSGGEALLKEAFEWQKMSARGMFRVMRLARTVADVNEHENVQEEDVAEAIFFQNGNQTGEEIRI
jgi:magnesium chelatase family protein